MSKLTAINRYYPLLAAQFGQPPRRYRPSPSCILDHASRTLSRQRLRRRRIIRFRCQRTIHPGITPGHKNRALSLRTNSELTSPSAPMKIGAPFGFRTLAFSLRPSAFPRAPTRARLGGHGRPLHTAFQNANYFRSRRLSLTPNFHGWVTEPLHPPTVNVSISDMHRLRRNLAPAPSKVGQSCRFAVISAMASEAMTLPRRAKPLNQSSSRRIIRMWIQRRRLFGLKS